MSDSPKLTRRDWFRLSKPTRDNLMGDDCKLKGAPVEAENGLQPIEHPPNHDGMNLEDLPPLREAMLTEADVASLFDDIRDHGTDVQLMQKRGARNSHANASSDSSMQLAKRLFLSGEVKRLQVRYRWNALLWIDTLVRQEEGTRLVRVSHQTP